MPKHFQASWTIFSRMIEAVAFIATASKGIGCRCCRCFLCRRTQVLQCKSANSTMARFSKYPTQSIASHIHKPLAIIHKLNCQVRVRRVASDQKYTWLNSIARIHVWKDIHAKDVCHITCLIWTWTCPNIFQASWIIFSLMKEAVAFIATASEGIGCCCCRWCFLLQKAPWQGFRNIQPNQYKEKQQMGLGRYKASHIHKSFTSIHKLNCQVRVRRVASDQKYT